MNNWKLAQIQPYEEGLGKLLKGCNDWSESSRSCQSLKQKNRKEERECSRQKKKKKGNEAKKRGRGQKDLPYSVKEFEFYFKGDGNHEKIFCARGT